MEPKIMVTYVAIEPKEDVTQDGLPPGLPTGADFDSYLSSYLADQTKHDGSIGWRILSVKSL